MANKVINVEIKPNLTGIRSLNSEISKMKSELDDATDAKQIDKLNKELGNTEKQIKDINKATDKFDLKKKFDDIYKETAPLSSRLGELEDRMYELSFAGKAGTDEFKALQLEAVSMRQTIIGVDKQVDILADNKGFSVFGDGIGQVGSSLASLDFETASKQATSLAGAASKISFGSAMTSVKQFGTTIIQLGKAILMNPLFLLAAVVAAIAYGIYKLLDALGVIKVIFDAVGAAIGWVVQQLKNFLDFLGLTNYAEQDAAEASAKSAEKRAAAYETASKRIVQALDQEIRMAELVGKDTTKLERKRLLRVKEGSKLDQEAALKRLQAERKKGDMTHSELVDLKKAYLEKKSIRRQNINNIRYFDAQQIQDGKDKIVRDMKARLSMNAATVKGQIAQLTYERNLALKNERLTQNEVLALKQKFNEDVAKIEADDRAERFATYKAYRDNRTSAERKIQDIELEFLEEGIDKELKANKYRFDRLIQDTKRNESINQKERKRLIDLYGKQRIDAEKEIQNKINQVNIQAGIDANKIASEQRTDFLNELEAWDEEQYQKKLSTEEVEMTAINDKYFRLIELAKQYGEDTIALEEAQAAEKAKITAKYAQESVDAEIAAKRQLQTAVVGIASQTAGLLQTVAGKNKGVALAGLALEKGAAIAGVIISAAKEMAANGVNAAANPLNALTGGAAGAAQLARANIFTKLRAGLSIATIAATGIQSAKSMGGGAQPTGSGGGGGGGGAASGGGQAQAQQTPNLEMFGQANNLNTFFQPGGQEQGQTLQAVISLDQLSTSQDKASSIYENSIL